MCKRTDTVPLKPVYKIMFEMKIVGGLFCYMEISISCYCAQCDVITRPATKSIPGSSLGPLLRECIMNIHEVAPTVCKIQRLQNTNHDTILGEGTISKGLAAISAHVEDGNLCEWAPSHVTEIMQAHSEPPVEIAIASAATTELPTEPVITATATTELPTEPAKPSSTATLPVPYSPYTRQQSGTESLLYHITAPVRN